MRKRAGKSSRKEKIPLKKILVRFPGLTVITGATANKTEPSNGWKSKNEFYRASRISCSIRTLSMR